MAHFAKLDENNVVVGVYPGSDDQDEQELTARTGDTYKQTSYNTKKGVHYTGSEPSADQSKAFRGNYAGVGYTYDETLDAFLPPKPQEDAILNETTFSWEIPAPSEA